mgnify:CR=1 FL=1
MCALCVWCYEGFLEALGYDVCYVSSVDMDETPEHVLRHRMFLSSGHDEVQMQHTRYRGLQI